MSAIARRIAIAGGVQGVGYRASLAFVAQAAGLAGFVRNRADGSVEALLQGDADAVARTIEWCRRGPPGARVATVDVAPAAVDQDRLGFRIDETQ